MWVAAVAISKPNEWWWGTPPLSNLLGLFRNPQSSYEAVIPTYLKLFKSLTVQMLFVLYSILKNTVVRGAGMYLAFVCVANDL